MGETLTNRRMSDERFGYLMISPAAIFILCVAVYPIFRIVTLSLFTQNLGTALRPEFSGVFNYIRVANDGRYWHTLRVTCLITALAVTLELVLGLVFALLLNRNFRGRSYARACILVPWALPTAVMALVWAWIFNDQFGVLNDLLRRAGAVSFPVAWLGAGSTALSAVILADVWKTTPFMAIILLAGLQNIPEELYEAAKIDGARALARFRLITLPLIVPSMVLALLFRTLQSIGIFDLIYVMTGGGPGGSTESLAIYAYSVFFRYLDFGYGAAVIVTTFALTAAAGLAAFLALGRAGREAPRG